MPLGIGTTASCTERSPPLTGALAAGLEVPLLSFSLATVESASLSPGVQKRTET